LEGRVVEEAVVLITAVETNDFGDVLEETS
jgi:hypothetical protein